MSNAGRPKELDPITIKTSCRFRNSEVLKMRFWARKRSITVCEYIRRAVNEKIMMDEKSEMQKIELEVQKNTRIIGG